MCSPWTGTNAPAARSASPPAPLEPWRWRPMPDIDVLVVGAGPAGSVAAWQAKQAAPELDVALLERDRAVGAPVRCAEGVGDAGLREFANPDGEGGAGGAGGGRGGGGGGRRLGRPQDHPGDLPRAG